MTIYDKISREEHKIWEQFIKRYSKLPGIDSKMHKYIPTAFGNLTAGTTYWYRVGYRDCVSAAPQTWLALELRKLRKLDMISVVEARRMRKMISGGKEMRDLAAVIIDKWRTKRLKYERRQKKHSGHTR